MVKTITTRRQKDVSRLLREKRKAYSAKIKAYKGKPVIKRFK